MTNLAFNFESKIKVNEVAGQCFISGTLMKSGISKNNRAYSVPILSQIAKDVIGKPLTYGEVRQMSPDGRIRILHNEENIIGKVVETKVFKAQKKVTFKALVTDLAMAQKIHEGFGISIGGIADIYEVLQNAGRKILNIIHMIVTHLAVLQPSVSVGIEGSQVEQVVHESMNFFMNGRDLTDDDLTAVIEALRRTGEI